MPTESHDDFSKRNVQSLREALKLGLTSVTELWRYPANDWVSSVHAADIDGDNDIEVLIGSRDGIMYTLSKRGGLKWKFESSNKWIGAVFSINDAEAVGRVRIVVGSRDNSIYALDKAGRCLWEYHTNHVVRQLYVYDINQDGKLEVIAGSEDRSIYVLECETGTFLWKYNTNGWVRTVFAADIDGDGEIEILAGSGDKNLYVLDAQGKLKWKYNTNSKVHTIFAADLDKDGVVEILIGSDAKDVQALKPDCGKKWQLDAENRILSIFAADVNSDGHLEVIAGSEDKHIYFLDDQGNLLWKHNLGFRIFSVYAVDLNRDGFLEVLVGAEDDSVHVLHVELVNGLLSKILNYYKVLGCPPSVELNLSSAECVLLQDLTGEGMLYEREFTITQSEQVLGSAENIQTLSMLLTLSDQNVELLWCKHIGHVRTVCLGDLDDDAGLEIVVGTDDGNVHAIDRFGKILWSYPLGDRVWTVQVADIQLDGVVEVVAGSADGHVYALSNTGDCIKWQIEMDDWIRSVYVNEFKQKDGIEIIMGSEDKKIYIYNNYLKSIIKPINTSQSVRAVCTYDIDADGVAEIIAGVDDNNVCAYTQEGVLLWQYRTTDRVRSLCIKDIDADGQLEILAGSEDRNIYVLDSQGHLKWRYYTPHRVLDIDVADIDQDGTFEVFLGTGDGYIYILSAVGDLLWRYKVSDRIRGIRAADLNRDGKIEIAVGSEDQMVYLLQVLDQQLLYNHIECCWAALQGGHPTRKLIHELVQKPDPYLRAFALVKLTLQSDLLDEDFNLLQELVNDASEHVMRTFARSLATLYRAKPDQTRRFLDLLAAHCEREVRLAFVGSLSSIAEVDWHVGFEYLDRFTRDTDRWVRRTVVRELHHLTTSFPQQVFRLLLTTAQDEKEWIRQETARTLAYYFNVHAGNLIVGLRSLIANSIETSLIKLIAYRSVKHNSRNLFLAVAELLSFDMDQAKILERLETTVKVLEETKSLECGEETWQLYGEFYRLHCMSTTEEIASYKYTPYQQEVEEAQFEGTLRVLQRLSDIADILRIYQRREGLGDRIVSLLEATASIDTLLADMEHGQFWSIVHQEYFTDWCILKPLLIRWRTIVTTELSRLRGKANLKAELKTKHVRQEERSGVVVSVSNDGRSPADNVRIRLKSEETFTIIGASMCTFETVSTHEPAQVEFTIKPHTYPVHLAFEITYDDAEGRDKLLQFGDRLEMKASKRAFKHIPNLYSVGIPIQDPTMFYGRKKQLAFFKENLAESLANTVIVLYGQRRSGKSSLLYQLVNTNILQPHIPIYIDMQHETIDLSTSKFLYIIARHIHRHLKKRAITITLPDQAEFEKDATFTLDVFLEDAEDILGDRKLVLLIDEFEVLEQKVKEQVLSQGIFEYLRSLMQHRRGINFLLSGTHTIEQLTAGYWSVFFNIARHRQLSKLSDDAAEQLISRPVKDYLEYDPFAVEKIRLLTGDQPYLIQLICRSLIEHCNHHHKNYVTVNDVNTVHNEVMETGSIHFKWIWEQTSPEERAVLSIMAQEGGEEGRHLSASDIEEICRDYGMSCERKIVGLALQKLAQADIIEEIAEGGRFRISVGLTRRWVREAKPLRKVIQEENLQAH